MDGLNHAQRLSLTQLQALTNGGDEQVAISVLNSVDWDVQKAAELIFDSPSSSRYPPVPAAAARDALDIDDSQQRGPSRHASNSSFQTFWSRVGPLWSFVAYPVHLLSNIFRFIFGVLRIPIPQLRFSNLSFYRPLPSGPSDPRSAADRWVRALEEETGGICISRASAVQDVMASGMDAGPSALASRSSAQGHVDGPDESKKLLPDFTLGSYEDILRMCQKEARIACVVLVSEEHDDVPEFRRSTLTNANFVRLLHGNDIIVWGGDVREQDAWSAAQKLQVTTYPFVAFLALQPRRGPATSISRSTGSPPTLTILSRHQGRCVPISAPTSAETLTEHLERQLLPRVTPFLDRIRTSMRDRERDRSLREEQDRAFRDSARRDRERIEAKMAEERGVVEERRKREEGARMEEERKRMEADIVSKQKALRMDWRRWSRKALALPDVSGCRDVLRIAIRLPGGARVIQHFSPMATLTTLYAYVDSQFIPQPFSPDDDPTTPPQGSASGEAAIAQQIQSSGVRAEEWWGFKLVTAYPRQEIKWDASRVLSHVDGLKGGGQVVVEILDYEQGRANETGIESDGYGTESD